MNNMRNPTRSLTVVARKPFLSYFPVSAFAYRSITVTVQNVLSRARKQAAENTVWKTARW